MSARFRPTVGATLFMVVLGGALTLWSSACSSEGPAAAADGTNPPIDLGGGCGTPNEGCPCDEPGKIVECGNVSHHTDDYVTCSMGKRECIGGRWGECIGDRFVTTKSFLGSGPLGGVRTAALGTAGPCPASGPNSNPCDPYCNVFVDDPTGLTLPTGGGTAPTCSAPIDWKAYYGAYTGLTRPNGALPTTCTAGPPNNCSNDTSCTAGACASRPPSTAGSCTGVDFTLSTPCYDGADFTFQLCNRGTVDATSGILPIAHNGAAPSAAASSCTRAVNGAAGQCNVDLTLTPLAAGQCRQITPASDCGIDTSVGVHSFYVNYANMPVVSTTPALAECNTCNNYTATTATAAGVANAACGAGSCGTAFPTGGQYPPNFSSLDGLNTGCSGATDNLVFGACTGAPGPYSNCGQDFHCDTALNKCVWNVPGDWVDNTCAGVDLTIGAGCDDGSTYHTPVCNRGKGTLPSGSTINVNINTNSWSPAAACTTNVGSFHCGLTTTQPLLSGQCIEIPGCTGGTGQRELIVNPAGTIPECTQCNNWAHAKTTGAGCSVACTVPPPAGVQIYGHSPTQLYRVDPVSYAVSLVGTMSGCGTVFDLALDASSNMYAVSSASKLYKVNYPATGAGAVTCTFLSNNPTSFNGLTFTPTSLLAPPPAAEPLHGQANNGGWYEIKLTAGGAPVTYTLKGYYGGSSNKIQSSGDAVGIIGDAEYAVVKSGTTSLPGGDHLWKVDANTGAKIADITPTGTGLGACYGIGYWGGNTFLFCGSPQSGIYTIDTTNGATNLVKATPTITWYGAGVTTSAPVLPPSPASPPPPVQYFTRDYQATCPVGTRLVWQYFSWQATIPSASSIQFYAQTSATPGAFAAPNMPASATPPAVNAGTAAVTTTPAGTWYQDANTVDWHLKNDPPGGQTSQEYLRITMKFNSGAAVPTLSNWKQTYDCVPAE